MAKKKTKKKKIFQLTWVYEPFEHLNDFYTKSMFGGLAVYCHGKMMMMIAESPGDRSYRGEVFNFDIWNGLLLPTNYEHHQKLRQRWPSLEQHPILKKWLYLPLETSGFESLAEEIAESVRKNDSLLGIFPKVD